MLDINLYLLDCFSHWEDVKMNFWATDVDQLCVSKEGYRHNRTFNGQNYARNFLGTFYVTHWVHHDVHRVFWKFWEHFKILIKHSLNEFLRVRDTCKIFFYHGCGFITRFYDRRKGWVENSRNLIWKVFHFWSLFFLWYRLRHGYLIRHFLLHLHWLRTFLSYDI